MFNADDYHLSTGCISEVACDKDDIHRQLIFDEIVVSDNGLVTIYFDTDLTFLIEVWENLKAEEDKDPANRRRVLIIKD